MSIIQPGSHLGPYEVIAQVGAGGMGEVWKARDTRLARSVAIKTSSEQFSERFEREARAVAALNHPHICQIYDVGPNYLVMEYIEGQPLPAPLPLDHALKYGAQICDALDAAHRKGIVHRDLKPANILVTKAGVKLLDFGLARIEPAVTADDDTEGGLTGKGQILGTLHYMSPEQLQGEKADSRSDIFSFGLVLYEMLTGKRAFDGSSPASVVAAILEREAPSVAGVAPAVLDRVLRRCLAKDPDSRWQSAADLKSELQWIAEGKSSATTASAPALRKWRERTAWALAAVFLAALLLAIAQPWRAPATGDRTSFAVYPPDGMDFGLQVNATVAIPQFAVSPDGRTIVFVASDGGAVPMLWLRPINDVVPHRLPGTENAQNPFWSPESRWVGFFSDGKLMKIPVDAGAAQVVAKGISDDPRGGSWGLDGTILYCDGNSAVFRVPSAGGGTVTPVTKVDLEQHENSHRWPQFLPDGRHFLYMVGSKLAEQSGVYVGSVDGNLKKRLIPVDTNGFYVSPGYILYVDRSTLFGWEFDAERLELKGQPFTVAEEVGRSSQWNGAFSASQTGALVYAKPNYLPGRLTWFDRGGKPLGSVGEGDYSDFRLSPDETKLAASLVDPKRGVPDIWLTDFARGSAPTKVSFGTGARLDASVIWSPDSHWILFRTNRSGFSNEFYRQKFGGNEAEPVLLDAEERAAQIGTLVNVVPTDWSFDGRYVLFSAPNPTSRTDLWRLPMIGDPKPEKFLPWPRDQIHGNFSPTDPVIAFSTNESGRFEVYASTIDKHQQWQISVNGGYEPRWRADGREIYYLSEDRKLMSVSVGAIPKGTGPSPFGVPRPLFPTRVATRVHAVRTHYDTRYGKRFLVNTQIGDGAPTPLTVVLNWTAELKK